VTTVALARGSGRIACLVRAGAVAVASVLAAATLSAQTSAPADTLAETRRLRDAGQFEAAARLIVPFVRAHPDSSGVAWLAAQTLYWAGRPAEARPLYEMALDRDPANVELRLDFARFLIETGDASRARDVLEIALDDPSGRPRALSLLGKLAYWNGDLRRARRLFIDALRADSSLADARERLLEIEAGAASWVRGGAGTWHDDQTLVRLSFEAAGAWFVDPLTPLAVRASSRTFDPGAAGIATGTFSQGEAGASTYFPSSRLDVSAAVGVVQRSVGSTTDWTGRVTIGRRLPDQITIRGRAERATYTNTIASLFRETMVSTLEATGEWRSPLGWLAEVTARRESFTDDNVVGTGYAWVLAPLVHRTGGDLRAGYSFSIQDSKRNAFVPRERVPDFPPGQTPPTVKGIYDPIYTPRNLQSHALLASATVLQSPRISWSANGSYGVSAHDDAPVLIAAANPGAPDATVTRAFYRRSFHPWMAHATVDARVGNEISVGLVGEHGRGAFYTYTTAGVQFTWTFTGVAVRRAARD